jgi:hypothetical protein
MIDGTQLELAAPASERTRSQCRISPDDPRIEQLVAWLRGRGWQHRAKAFAAIGETVSEGRPMGVSDRLGRLLMEMTGGRIISSSQLGYRLTEEATLSEITHAENELESRERALKARRVAIARVRHSGGNQNHAIE